MTQPPNPPQTIYLQWWDGCGDTMPEITWSSDQIHSTDAVYQLTDPGTPWEHDQREDDNQPANQSTD